MIGAFTLVSTPGPSTNRGWVTLIVGVSEVVYGTYCVDGSDLVMLDILGGTGRFTLIAGSLVGSKDVLRSRWWLSGTLAGLETT